MTQKVMIANFKGGASKSTTAISLAVCASQRGFAVLLIDCDPQGTAHHWFSRRQQRRVETTNLLCAPYTASDRDLFERYLHAFDYVLFDTGAGKNAVSIELMRQMDLCLVPLRPTALDIQGTVPTIEALKPTKVPFAFVLQQCYAGHSPRRDETLRILQARGLVAPTCLSIRVDHQDAFAQGLGVTEFAENGHAAEEVRTLWLWLEGRLANGARAA